MENTNAVETKAESWRDMAYNERRDHALRKLLALGGPGSYTPGGSFVHIFPKGGGQILVDHLVVEVETDGERAARFRPIEKTGEPNWQRIHEKCVLYGAKLAAEKAARLERRSKSESLRDRLMNLISADEIPGMTVEDADGTSPTFRFANGMSLNVFVYAGVDDEPALSLGSLRLPIPEKPSPVAVADLLKAIASIKVGGA